MFTNVNKYEGSYQWTCLWMPTRTQRPRPMEDTTSPSTDTEAEATRCTTTFILMENANGPSESPEKQYKICHKQTEAQQEGGYVVAGNPLRLKPSWTITAIRQNNLNNMLNHFSQDPSISCVLFEQGCFQYTLCQGQEQFRCRRKGLRAKDRHNCNFNQSNP